MIRCSLVALMLTVACTAEAPKADAPQEAKATKAAKPTKAAPAKAAPKRKPKPKFEVPRLLFVLPSVQSLAAADASGTKQATIVEVARKFGKRLGDYYDFGLVQTGHASPDGCGEVRTTTAAGFKIRTALTDALADTRPAGEKLGLTNALEEIGRRGFVEASKTNVVIITDGADGCGNDPCAAVETLAAKAKALKIHVVGYGLSDADAKALSCVATGGGEVTTVTKAAELEGAVELALGEDLCPPMAMPCWEQSLRSPMPTVREMVVEHCCGLTSPVAFRCPYKAMRDTELAIRKKAFGCILAKTYSREDEALLLALHDDDPEQRDRAIARLESKRLTKRQKKVMLKAVTDPQPKLRGRAITHLGKTIGPWTKEVIESVLSGGTEDARREMVEALGNRYDPVAFDTLGLATKDASPDIRAAAAHVLGKTKDPRAKAHLEALKKDKAKLRGGGSVAREAKRALETLGGAK